MIAIQIGEEKDRIRQWASCGELRVVKSKADPALALARALVVVGYDPDEPLEIKRGGAVCLRFKTLSEAAGLIVEENDKIEVRLRKYRPPPAGGFGQGRENGGLGEEE